MNAKRILCPVDFSEGSNTALAYATTLAMECDAELHIVYVYEEPYAYTDGGFSGYVPPADMDPDRQRLEATRPTSDSVRFRREFLIGSPANTLLKYADSHDIDLIVMGTHGRTGLSRLLMGSVAETMVRRALCPVLTIKSPIGHEADAKDEQQAADKSPETV